MSVASHKFTVGDRVRLILDSGLDYGAQDVYTVARMLPAQANVWQYRVKRVGDGQERAVSEPQIVKMTLDERTGSTQIEAQRDLQRVRNVNALRRAQSVARRADRDGR
jgi:hypothetical protein